MRIATKRQSRNRTVSRCLFLERIEDRTVLSAFYLPVTSLADTGPGTLRAAITTADAGSAAHTYNIEFKVFCTITLESALPDLSKSMNINGSGARRLTVQRDPTASSAFSIFVVKADEAVRITGMTIANGVGTVPAFSGGGISNFGKLTVSHTTISGNSGRYSGGGIFNDGTLTVSHTTISGNSAANGAGIFNEVHTSGFPIGGITFYGMVTVSHSTISGNTAGYSGGGIDNDGKLTVSHSTISGNSATSGGGIYNDSNEANTLTNSTVDGNTPDDLYNLGTFQSKKSVVGIID